MKKFISLLLSLVCMFSLTGCFSDLSSLFGMGNMEPDKVIVKMQKYLDDSDLKEDNMYYKIEYDEDFQNYVLTLSHPEMNDLAVASIRYVYKNSSVSGSGELVKAWDNLTEMAKQASKDVEAKIRTYDDDAYLVVNLVNYDNQEDILLSVSGGVVLENLLDLY